MHIPFHIHKRKLTCLHCSITSYKYDMRVQGASRHDQRYYEVYMYVCVCIHTLSLLNGTKKECSEAYADGHIHNVVNILNNSMHACLCPVYMCLCTSHVYVNGYIMCMYMSLYMYV